MEWVRLLRTVGWREFASGVIRILWVAGIWTAALLATAGTISQACSWMVDKRTPGAGVAGWVYTFLAGVPFTSWCVIALAAFSLTSAVYCGVNVAAKRASILMTMTKPAIISLTGSGHIHGHLFYICQVELPGIELINQSDSREAHLELRLVDLKTTEGHFAKSEREFELEEWRGIEVPERFDRKTSVVWSIKIQGEAPSGLGMFPANVTVSVRDRLDGSGRCKRVQSPGGTIRI